jgi:hypothetical protein
VSVRFLADEDLKAAIIPGMRLREPSIDIVDVKTAGLRGARDGDLLELPCAERRVLISHDRNTMVDRFCQRVAAGQGTAGLCIVPQQGPTGEIIERLLALWVSTTPEEWHDRIEFVPSR